MSRCYEHGQPDYVLAGDTIKSLATAIEQRDARIAELGRELAKCGRENCFGHRADGQAWWVREERLLEAQAALSTATRDALEQAAKIFEEGSHELWMPEEAAAAIRALVNEGSEQCA